MKADEYAHIREDVRQAILEAARQDPPVTTEILFRLLDQVGAVAVGHGYGVPDGPLPITTWSGRLGYSCRDAEVWAEALLLDVQTRAITRVPYGELTPIEPHEEIPYHDPEKGYRD